MFPRNIGSRVYVIKRHEAKDTPNVVIRTFFIHFHPITVFFNFGISHSFVASSIVDKLELVHSLGLPTIYVSTPTRDSVW